MKNKFLKYTELLLFYSGVGLNIWILLHFTFIGGQDGPSHLYYSRVLNYLFRGNTFISQYFVINHLPVPNLTDHYLLALLDFFFSSVISQKILLTIYLVGFPLCFRHIIKKYNPGSMAASSFIIPFTHCWMFYFGTYNLCISFTFLFWAIYYYTKNFSDTTKLYSAAKYFIFFWLVLLNYFTNGINFLFLVLICTITELYWFLPKIKELRISYILKRIYLFCMLWLPGLVMLYISNNALPDFHRPHPARLPFTELLTWFYDFHCLSVTGEKKGVYAHIIFYWLILTLVLTVFGRLKDSTLRKFLFSDIFLIAFIISTIAYFIIPQDASVGMISDRLFYSLIIFLLAWIALQTNIKQFVLPLTAILLTIHAFFFFTTHLPILADLDKDELDVQKASAYIKPNSIVAPFNVSDKPIEASITNLLGIDKPLVVIEKYEPDLGWFAIKRTIPNQLVVRSSYGDYLWANTDDTTLIHMVDYLMVHGSYSYAMRCTALKQLKGYIRIFSSDDSLVHVLQIDTEYDFPPRTKIKFKW